MWVLPRRNASQASGGEEAPAAWPCQLVEPCNGFWSGLWLVSLFGLPPEAVREEQGATTLHKAAISELVDFASNFARFRDACPSRLFQRALRSAIEAHAETEASARAADLSAPSGSTSAHRGASSRFQNAIPAHELWLLQPGGPNSEPIGVVTSDAAVAPGALTVRVEVLCAHPHCDPGAGPAVISPSRGNSLDSAGDGGALPRTPACECIVGVQ